MKCERAILKLEGYRVVRFWNNDVMANIDGVLAAIDDCDRCRPRPPPPTPPRRKREGSGE